ncbi:unnamed protein product [Soboliphyme baturini]|uniref:Homeobox domain-containing protein n=1 Tax=Soboliphyme baturini TaxID=241478 RepID=A0A183IHS6_9BILA|nr:unnamed protein product [Soboliphyme baturini]
MLCCNCKGQIRDPYYAQIGVDYWHEQCVRCSKCHRGLSDKCYQKFGAIYCMEDYYRLFSPHRCFLCSTGIAPSDQVYKITSSLMCHQNCNRCYQCNHLMQPGETIRLDQHSKQLYCSAHFTGISMFDAKDESVGTTRKKDTFLLPKTEPHFSRVSATSGDVGTSLKHDGAELVNAEKLLVRNYIKRRGPRTTIKTYQLDLLNKTFSKTPKPSKHERAKLSLDTGLSLRVIQVWFQNRRSKDRRLKHLCNWIRQNEHKSAASTTEICSAPSSTHSDSSI